MAAKRTYSVRLDDDQRRQLEERAGGKLAVGNLIRCAIDAYLRQEEERDYLADVEARIAATINRLARQVEKDRAEQQIVVAMLDGLREWLAEPSAGADTGDEGDGDGHQFYGAAAGGEGVQQ